MPTPTAADLRKLAAALTAAGENSSESGRLQGASENLGKYLTHARWQGGQLLIWIHPEQRAINPKHHAPNVAVPMPEQRAINPKHHAPNVAVPMAPPSIAGYLHTAAADRMARAAAILEGAPGLTGFQERLATGQVAQQSVELIEQAAVCTELAGVLDRPEASIGIKPYQRWSASRGQSQPVIVFPVCVSMPQVGHVTFNAVTRYRDGDSEAEVAVAGTCGGCLDAAETPWDSICIHDWQINPQGRHYNKTRFPINRVGGGNRMLVGAEVLPIGEELAAQVSAVLSQQSQRFALESGFAGGPPKLLG